MVNKITSVSSTLLSAAVSGAMAAAAIGVAPTASADCASFFGLGNTANCQSGPTSIAIAIGPNATATAAGWFGVALAVGRVPLIGTDNLGVATATTGGAFTFAWAWGDNVTAQAGDLIGIATQWGTNGTTITTGAFNIAQAITNPFPFLVPPTTDIGMTVANGFGNVVTNGAFVTEPGKSVSAVGFGNFAFNGWGFNNVVKSGGTNTSFFNTAFDVFTSGDVTAGPGPFAVAIAFGQQPGESTTQTGPGIKVGVGTGLPAFPASAALARPTKKAAPKPKASSANSGKKKTSLGAAAPRVRPHK